MFEYNSSEHSSIGKQPYELLYGKTLLVPNSLTNAPEARYNYGDYQTELKPKRIPPDRGRTLNPK
jgi:hypothetical protein